MNESTIFNNYLELDCFCMDIAEAWIKHRQDTNKEISSDKFLDWVESELYPALENNFGDVYEEEFGYREGEED